MGEGEKLPFWSPLAIVQELSQQFQDDMMKMLLV